MSCNWESGVGCSCGDMGAEDSLLDFCGGGCWARSGPPRPLAASGLGSEGGGLFIRSRFFHGMLAFIPSRFTIGVGVNIDVQITRFRPLQSLYGIHRSEVLMPFGTGFAWLGVPVSEIES